jgi:hypothetical protein
MPFTSVCGYTRRNDEAGLPTDVGGGGSRVMVSFDPGGGDAAQSEGRLTHRRHAL